MSESSTHQGDLLVLFQNDDIVPDAPECDGARKARETCCARSVLWTRTLLDGSILPPPMMLKLIGKGDLSTAPDLEEVSGGRDDEGGSLTWPDGMTGTVSEKRSKGLAWCD